MELILHVLLAIIPVLLASQGLALIAIYVQHYASLPCRIVAPALLDFMSQVEHALLAQFLARLVVSFPRTVPPVHLLAIYQITSASAFKVII